MIYSEQVLVFHFISIQDEKRFLNEAEGNNRSV